MSLSGLAFILDADYINSENLLVYYNFNESGAIINKAPSYSGQFSGILAGSPSFFLSSGTGYATNNRVSITNSGDFWSSDFTHIFSIQRTGSANDNFFSSLAYEGLSASGYTISSNDAGRLIFGYRDCNGPHSITSDFTLNYNSNFAVSKRGNSISLYQYIPVYDIFNGFDARINSSEIFQSNYADLFFGNYLPIGFLKDYYSGYAFHYLYFNAGLSANQIVDIISGVYSDVYTITGGSGYSSGGHYILPSGDTTIISGIAPPSRTLSKNGIVLLRNLPTSSKVLVDYTINTDNINWGNRAIYDFTKESFLLNESISFAPIIYLNGQRVLSGVAGITGQFCQTGLSFSRDYQFSGTREIFDFGGYQSTDTVVYDLPYASSVSWQNLYSGIQSVSINNGSGYAVYLNGQRIKDYAISGTSLILDQLVQTTDTLCLDAYPTGYESLGEEYTSGFFFTSGYFAEGTSRVYLNGQRMLLGEDYLEVSSGTLLQGVPLQKPTGTVVTLSEYTLWNL